jgi:hypothetical protein
MPTKHRAVRHELLAAIREITGGEDNPDNNQSKDIIAECFLS